MWTGAKASRFIRRIRGAEAGFTLIELMSAMIVTTLGVAALVTTLDSSRELITFSESKEAAVHVGEQELERIQSLPYADVALEDEPVPCSAGPVDQVCDLNNPADYVTEAWYRWDQRPWGDKCSADGQPREKCEALVINTATDATPGTGQVTNLREARDLPGPNGVRLQIEMQRFISWVDDDCVKPAPDAGTCVGDHDYKRITVAVRILRATTSQREQLVNGGPGRPILLSTVVRPPSEPVL